MLSPHPFLHALQQIGNLQLLLLDRALDELPAGLHR